MSLQSKHMLSSSSLWKLKRYLLVTVGENLEKVSILHFISKGSMSLLNTKLRHMHVWVGKSICLTIIEPHWNSSWFWVLSLSQMLPSQLSCHYVFKRSSTSVQVPLQILAFNRVVHPWVSPCKLFAKLDIMFHVVGFPTLGHFLLTSAHYLGSWYRDLQYLEACMP